MRIPTVLFLVAACGQSRAVAGPVASLAEPRATHSATLLSDGTILIAGGFRKGPDGYSQLYSSTTEIFDPKTANVSVGPPLRHARAGHASVTLRDGSILAIGGWDKNGPTATCELFDPMTRTWQDAGVIAEARGGATATLLDDGTVALIGGGDDRGSTTRIEIYDPINNTWSSGGTLTMPRSGHTATLLPDGTVLVVGGSTARDKIVASVERYDPKLQTSATFGALDTPRYKHAATLLPDGDVLVIGGSDERDWKGKYATTERFDPRTGKSRASTALTKQRFKMPRQVVVLSDGAVAIAGGAATVEVIRDGASTEVADLGRASYYGTATLLASGELVVIGGYDDRVRTQSSVWRIRLSRS